jgi:hypothetical protein
MSDCDELLAFFKLLSDVDRLRVAGLLASHPATSEEIAAELMLPGAAVVHHLSRLQQAGFVTVKTDVYAFNTAALQAQSRRLLAHTKPLPSGAEGLEFADQKTVADFCSADGRLKAIPAHGRKFEAILRCVVTPFDHGTTYAEKDVNAILERFHEDTATLRRGLVDYRLMARQAGVYWRLKE